VEPARVVTTAIAAGTSLIGAFRQGGQIFRRRGLTIEASNSHQDFFQKNLTAIRAEERLALVTYRPTAFYKLTGVDQLEGS
jgi:HK97 family phage major capsid protein